MKKLLLISALMAVLVIGLLNLMVLLITPIAVLSAETSISPGLGVFYFSIGCIFEAGLLLIFESISTELSK